MAASQARLRDCSSSLLLFSLFSLPVSFPYLLALRSVRMWYLIDKYECVALQARVQDSNLVSYTRLASSSLIIELVFTLLTLHRLLSDLPGLSDLNSQLNCDRLCGLEQWHPRLMPVHCNYDTLEVSLFQVKLIISCLSFQLCFSFRHMNLRLWNCSFAQTMGINGWLW